jgi:hypothetical protein
MEVKNSRRPKIRDTVVRENIAGRLFPNVREWLEGQGEIFTPVIEQSLFDEIIDLLRQDSWDGYDLARELEERSWSPNGELVAILHEVEILAFHALREEIVRWSTTISLAPSHKVGEYVMFQLKSKEPSMTGQVVKVHATLEYSVKMPSGNVLLIPIECVVH